MIEKRTEKKKKKNRKKNYSTSFLRKRGKREAEKRGVEAEGKIFLHLTLFFSSANRSLSKTLLSLRLREPAPSCRVTQETLFDGRGGTRAKTASGLEAAKRAREESIAGDLGGGGDSAALCFRALRCRLHSASGGASDGIVRSLFQTRSNVLSSFHAERVQTRIEEPRRARNRRLLFFLSRCFEFLFLPLPLSQVA